MIIGLKP